MDSEEGWFIPPPPPPISPVKPQKTPYSTFFPQMKPAYMMDQEEDAWEEDDIDSDEADPEDLARRLVDAVGIKRARHYINETQRGQIIWFSTSQDDIRQKLPIDIQWTIITMMEDHGEDLRCMSCVSKAWCDSIRHLVTRQRSLLLPSTPNGLDGLPFVVVGCRGMIIPSVHNGKFCPKDQRIPIVSRKRGELYIMAFESLTFDIHMLYLDKDGRRQTLRRLTEKDDELCYQYETIDLRFPPFPSYQKGFDPHCQFIVTAKTPNDIEFVASYPVRHLSSGSLLQVRQKIHGEFPEEGKPAGFCIHCGKARKKGGNCPVCGKSSTIIKYAYSDWQDFP